MSEVFILGAGFSKAISGEMPVTRELSKEVFGRFKDFDSIDSQIKGMINEDFEKALTFLAQDKPWLTESQNLRHRALFLDLTEFIRGLIHEKCRSLTTWKTNCAPPWLEALITYWHRKRSIVITLNYDTLIERVASSGTWPGRSEKIRTGLLYPIPLSPAARRLESSLEDQGGLNDPVESFRLLKLHGSINWFYSGRSEFYGEELYYVPCENGLDGTFDSLSGKDSERQHWHGIEDKTALIIPPLLDKGIFFQHESLRSLWFQASKAIQNATKIICMGYSLPPSDLTMAEFLKTSAPKAKPTTFELVNPDPDARDHFIAILGDKASTSPNTKLNGVTFDFRQNGADLESISKFVRNNCVGEEERIHLIQMSPR